MNLMVLQQYGGKEGEEESERERDDELTFVLYDNADAVSLTRGPDVTQGKFDSAYTCRTVSV